MSSKMFVGLDFDNTIVCYDTVFHRVAVESGLVPDHIPLSKNSVRDHLRRQGREDEWTELQGTVYGPRLNDAPPFPGALEFLGRCADESVDVAIISHKTRHPYRGPRYDLHASARRWLERHGVFDPARIGLPLSRVFFELTREGKLHRIAAMGCTHFVDDLPEFLAEPGFPDGVEKILFNPNGLHANGPDLHHAASWEEIGALLLGREDRSHAAR